MLVLVVVIMVVAVVTVAASLNYLRLQVINILTLGGLLLISTSPDR